MSIENLPRILEAAILAAGEPVSLERLRDLFHDDDNRPTTADLRAALASLSADCEQRGIELREVASGFCYQAKSEYSPWVKNLWQEKAPRYSRALLETLAIIAYRQPITRSEIEEIRGVAVSTNIVKTLLEREWVRVVGHREVPGRPSVYGTTKEFLDNLNLSHLEQLPPLQELTDLEAVGNDLAHYLESANTAIVEGEEVNGHVADSSEAEAEVVVEEIQAHTITSTLIEGEDLSESNDEKLAVEYAHESAG